MLMTRSNSARQQAVEDFVTIEEAERLTGYTGQYLRRMARQGRIRAIKFGGFWMVHLAALQEYLRSANARRDRRYGPRDLPQDRGGENDLND